MEDGLYIPSGPLASSRPKPPPLRSSEPRRRVSPIARGLALLPLAGRYYIVGVPLHKAGTVNLMFHQIQGPIMATTSPKSSKSASSTKVDLIGMATVLTASKPVSTARQTIQSFTASYTTPKGVVKEFQGRLSSKVGMEDSFIIGDYSEAEGRQVMIKRCKQAYTTRSGEAKLRTVEYQLSGFLSSEENADFFDED